MATGLLIASAVLLRLRALAAASPDIEICGLLLGRDPSSIDEAIPAANVAPDPARAFEIDPAALFAALRAERAGGPRVLGHYHSHPHGDPVPSPRDAAASDGAGTLWLILGHREALLWRAVAGGAVLGAFDPVPLAVAQAGASRHKGADLAQGGDE